VLVVFKFNSSWQKGYSNSGSIPSFLQISRCPAPVSFPSKNIKVVGYEIMEYLNKFLVLEKYSFAGHSSKELQYLFSLVMYMYSPDWYAYK